MKRESWLSWYLLLIFFSLITVAITTKDKQILQKSGNFPKRYRKNVQGFPVISASSKNFWVSENKTSEITVGDRFSGILGSFLIINCPFKGNPYPRATWFFNGRVVDHVQFKNIDITEPKGVSVLKLHGIDNDLVGQYKCMVLNSHGRTESVAYVRMIDAWQPTIFSQRYAKTFDIVETTANISIGVDATLFEGVKLTIYCNIKSKTNNVQIQWLTDASSENFKKVTTNDRVLNLGLVALDDSGTYSCVVNGGIERGDLQKTKLTILGKRSPIIESRNGSVRYIRGSSFAVLQIGETAIIKAGFKVKIACPFTSMPVGKAVWKRNGMTLALPSDNIHVEKYRNQLVIERIEERHADVYTCVVDNTIGRVSASSTITVIPIDSRAPKISSGRRSRTVEIYSTTIVPVRIGETVRIIEGAPLKLICAVSGVPKPVITWELNRKSILDDAAIQIGTALLILNFQKQHVGDYKCRANNLVGEARVWSDVRMIVPSSPTITSSASILKIAEKGSLVEMTIGDKLKTTGGRDISIFCPTTGYPIAKLLWKLEDKMIKGNEKVVMNDKRRIILLKNADEWSSGVYSCFATNGAGVATSSSRISILPEGAPLITSKEKVEKSLDQSRLVDIEIGTNLTTTVGKTLRILCPSEGTNQSYYEWTINNKQLHYDTRINLNNGYELIINGLQFFDDGVYACRVYSQYGYDRMTSQIKIVASQSDSDNSNVNNGGHVQPSSDGIFRTTSGYDITVISGQSIEIKCPTWGSLHPQLSWLKNSQPITPTSILIPKGEKLLLRSTDKTSMGKYTCVIKTELGVNRLNTNVKIIQYKKLQIQSETGSIKAVNPKIVAVAAIGNDILAIKGVTIKIQCPHTAVPPAKITWFMNSIEIDKSGQVFIQEKGTDALIIQKMSENYKGKYTCQGKQESEIVDATTHVDLIDMTVPVITKSQKTLHTNPVFDKVLQVNVGDSVIVNQEKSIEIHCPVTGMPKPHVSWKFNGKDLSLVSGVADSGNGSIFISLTNWWHTGVYECFCVNQAGLDTAKSVVDVVAKYLPLKFKAVSKDVKLLEAKEKVIKVSVGTNITTVAGNSVLLQCQVDKYGKVNIIWEKSGAFFQGTSYRSDGSVLIRNLKMKDGGVYVCYSDDMTKWKFGSIFVKIIIPVEQLLQKGNKNHLQLLQPVSKDIEIIVGSLVTTLHGNTFKLKCPVRDGISDIKWLKNGRLISNTKNKYSIDEDILVIKDKLGVGVHNFSCQVTGDLGKAEVTSEVHILAQQKIQIKQAKQSIMSTKSQSELDLGGNALLLEGSSIDLNCLAIGSPLPKINWSYNGVTLTGNNGVYFKRGGLTLSILELSQKHGGTYKCSTVDAYGEELFAFMEISVYAPKKPTIVSTKKRTPKAGILNRPIEVIANNNGSGIIGGTKVAGQNKIMIIEEIGSDYKILSGPELKLMCSTDGVPKPSIIWKKDGVELSNKIESITLDTADINSNGMYICTASNGFGSVSETSLIDIVVPSKPVIQRDLEKGHKTDILSYMDGSTKNEVFIGDDLKTISGTIVCIRCPAIGIPRPEINFLKDGKPLQMNDRIRIDHLGSLIISKASKKQFSEGIYTCHATNEAGFDQLDTTLILYDPVKPSFLPPTEDPKYTFNNNTGKGILHMSIGQSVRTYRNTYAYIKCPVSGFPFPVVIWEKDNEVLQNGGVAILKDNATILVYEILEDTVVRCTATNMVGIEQITSVITVIEPLPAKILVPKFEVKTAESMSVNITIGNNANILSGSKLVITCPSIGIPKPTIFWSLESSDGTWLEEQDNVKFASDGYSIVINSITKDFSGGYRCNATNVFGADTQLSFISITDLELPKISVSKKKFVTKKHIREIVADVGSELHVLLDTRVLLDCPVSGFPPPKVTWYKNGRELQENIDYDSATHILTLNKVKLINEGTYTCVAQTFSKTVKAETKLFVGEEPTIKPAPGKLSPLVSLKEDSELFIPIGVQKSLLRMKSTATFKCSVQGYPLPKIEWSFKNFPIDFDNGKKYESLIPSMLRVKKVTPNDSGTYACHAENMFGTAMAITSLEVMEPPSIIPKKVNITRTKYSKQIIYATIGGSIVVIKGVSIIISCPVTGSPNPVVKWSKMNSSFVIDPRMYVTFDKHFRINNVQYSDSGKYSCTAMNEVGAVNSSTVLLVAEKPTAVIFPHYRSSKTGKTNAVFNGKGKLIVPLQTHLRLFCHVTGSPNPKITWLKDHDLVRASNNQSVNEQELEVEFVTYKDAGTYVCMAGNVLGVTTALMDVTIGVPPSILKTNISTNSQSSEFVDVSVGASINLQSGSVLTILCNVSGIPKAQITWKKNDQILFVPARIKTGTNDVLVLRNFTKKMEGRYTCHAENMIGADVASTDVSVVDGAEIISDIASRKDGDFIVHKKKVTQVHVIEGQRLQLTCYGGGNPLPNVSFIRRPSHFSRDFLHSLSIPHTVNNVSRYVQLKNGTVSTLSEKLPNEFKLNIDKRRLSQNGERRHVIVATISVRSVKLRHNGKYMCKVQNDIEQDQALVEIYVYPFPKRPYTGVWKATEYSICNTPCVRANYGTQSRSIVCISFNGKQVNETKCDHASKPISSSECVSQHCATSWNSGKWSKCSQTCGEDGIQNRSPLCVYSSTNEKIDPKNCPIRSKPSTLRKCNIFPCDKDACVDKYQYCPLMKKLEFCGMETYKTLCCYSCIQNRLK